VLFFLLHAHSATNLPVKQGCNSKECHGAASEDRHGGGAAGDGTAFDSCRVVLDRAPVDQGRSEGAIADGAAGLASRVLLEDALPHDYISWRSGSGL
jgi:hypothetical protein